MKINQNYCKKAMIKRMMMMMIKEDKHFKLKLII